MAIYVVMEPGEARAVDADRTIYVRDGFSVIAFLVPVVWLLWHRLWIEAALAFAAALAIGTLGDLLGLNTWLTVIFSLLVALYVGLEGPALRIAALRRRGWAEQGVVKADNRGEAEARYLSETVTEDSGEERSDPGAPTGPRARPAPVGPALGLLGYPGER